MVQPKVLSGGGHSRRRRSALSFAAVAWALRCSDGGRCALYSLSGKADRGIPAVRSMAPPVNSTGGRYACLALATREPLGLPSTSQMRWPAAMSLSMWMPVSMPRPLSR